MSTRDAILILGAGGHGQVVADLLLRSQEARSTGKPVGFVDDDPGRIGRRLLGIPVLGRTSELSAVDHDSVIVAIGDNRRRAAVLEDVVRHGERVTTAIHPTAVIAPDVVLGRGVVVCAGVVVNTGTVVEDGTILNTGSVIDHHCQIGACSHIGPGARLAGRVQVGEGVLVGIGATVLPACKVGPWAVVGAGAVVHRDIPAHLTVVGVPARDIGGRNGC